METDRQKSAVDAGSIAGEPAPEELREDLYEVELKDAITGEILGFGGGATPEEAARRAIEDANVSHELDEPLETNNEGVRD